MTAATPAERSVAVIGVGLMGGRWGSPRASSPA